MYEQLRTELIYILTYPQKLKNLFVYENCHITILGSLEDNFFAKASNIMKDFLVICEHLDNKGVVDYLNSKHPTGVVKQFLKKIEKYQQSIFQQEGEVLTPYDFNNNKLKTLTLNLSRDCNLRCTYCFEGIDFRKSTGMMDKDTAILATELFITQLGDDNGTIIFTGGESLLNFNVIKEIINLISEKKKDNVKFFIKTNGTLITEEICEYLVEHDVDLQISIDGHKTVHDYHRVFPNGKGSFEKVTKVINLLLERNYGHKVVLRATVTHHTVQFLEESFRYLKNHKGIRVFDIAPVMGQDGQDFVLTDDDTLMYAEHLFNIAKEEFLINSEKYNNINLKFDGICGIGVWHLSIDVNGDIYPCYRLSGIREFLVGNIFKSGLSTTIPDKLAKLYSVSSRQECSNCYAKVLCQKGCYADKLLRSHSDICDDFLKQIGEFFLIENLVKSNAHMFLPLI